MQVEAKRLAEIDAKEAAKQARWAAIEEEKRQKREAAAKLAQQQKAERDSQMKMDALVAAAKKASNNFFIGMRVRVRPPGKRRFRATTAATLRRGPASDATVLGKLAPNEEITELEDAYEEGVNRIRCSRGWCNAAALVAIGGGAGDAAFTQVRCVHSARDGLVTSADTLNCSMYYLFREVCALRHDMAHQVGLVPWSEQSGTVVNIRVRPSSDGSAPGIKVKLTSGTQQYFTFSDVVPYVHNDQEGRGENGEMEYVLADTTF